MRTLVQDLRHAVRVLLQAPGFAALALATLALGIGANTAIFSIVSPMLFQPLPFPDSGRMMQVVHVYHGERQNGLNGSEALYLAARQRSFSAVTLVDVFGASNLVEAGPAAKVSALRVTHGFFQVFGVAPRLGRGFTAADDAPGAPATAVISDGLWRSHFAADPHILGRTFRLNDPQYTIVGVMPPGFSDFEQGPSGFTQTDLWTDMQPTEAALAPLGPNLDLLGRLRPGVTLRQAQAELDLDKTGFNQIYPKVASRMRWGVQSYHDAVVGDTRQPLLLLLGAVGMVLLIACANLANLLLARATGRRREMAIRTALGASQGRIVRQLLTESLLLAALGGAAGCALAWLAVPVLQRLAPPDIALPFQAGLSLPALVFTAAIALAAGVLFGLAPAWQASRLALHSDLKDSSAGAAAGHAGKSRAALIVAEVAVAFILLAGAALLTDSLVRLNRVAPGFDTHHVLTAQTTLTGMRATQDAAATRYDQDVLDRLRRIPGVVDAASITGLPLTRAMNYPIEVTGHPNDPAGDDTEWRAISPGFFHTLSIHLAAGRDFAESDTATGAPVAIVSQVFANHFWPHQSALGQSLLIPDPTGNGRTGTFAQVVGVAADVHENGVDSRPPFTIYVPQAQASDAIHALVSHWFAQGFVIRTTGTGAAPAVRQAFTAVDANQPVYDVVGLDALKGDSLSHYRFMSQLLGFFALLAFILGGIGIYGVLAYAVAQRRREIGIRLALGASRGRILRQFLGDGLRLAGMGLVIGALGAIGLTRLLAGFLFGVAPTDPAMLGLAAAALLALAWFASLQPAWKATRVDPLESLRT